MSKWAGIKVYDVDLHEDKDVIRLWRKGRISHYWTKAEAEQIRDALNKLIPQMKPTPHPKD